MGVHTLHAVCAALAGLANHSPGRRTAAIRSPREHGGVTCHHSHRRPGAFFPICWPASPRRRWCCQGHGLRHSGRAAGGDRSLHCVRAHADLRVAGLLPGAQRQLHQHPGDPDRYPARAGGAGWRSRQVDHGDGHPDPAGRRHAAAGGCAAARFRGQLHLAAGAGGVQERHRAGHHPRSVAQAVRGTYPEGELLSGSLPSGTGSAPYLLADAGVALVTLVVLVVMGGVFPIRPHPCWGESRHSAGMGLGSERGWGCHRRRHSHRPAQCDHAGLDPGAAAVAGGGRHCADEFHRDHRRRPCLRREGRARDQPEPRAGGHRVGQPGGSLCGSMPAGAALPRRQWYVPLAA